MKKLSTLPSLSVSTPVRAAVLALLMGAPTACTKNEDPCKNIDPNSDPVQAVQCLEQSLDRGIQAREARINVLTSEIRNRQAELDRLRNDQTRASAMRMSVTCFRAPTTPGCPQSR